MDFDGPARRPHAWGVPSPRNLCLVVLAVVLATGCEAAPSTAPGPRPTRPRCRRIRRRHGCPRSRATSSTATCRTGRWTTGSTPTCGTCRSRRSPCSASPTRAWRDQHRPAGLPCDHGRPGQAAHRRGARAGHARGARLHQLRRRRNTRLFEDVERQDAVIESLVDLVDETRVDGINVDVEVLDPTLIPAYGAFVGGSGRPPGHGRLTRRSRWRPVPARPAPRWPRSRPTRARTGSS